MEASFRLIAATLLALSAGTSACAHGTATPTGRVRAQAENKDRSVAAVHVRGTFTGEDLQGISVAVRNVDDQPLFSIVQSQEGVEVRTGALCGEDCGGGNFFVLRKVKGTWTIVDRGAWSS
jgi:hypothetical protein